MDQRTARDIIRSEVVLSPFRPDALYRRIVEDAREGVWVVDDRQVTTLVNRWMAGLLGYEVDELIGKPVDAFLLVDELTEHGVRMQRRRQGEAETYECRFCRKDGSVVWLRVSASPIIDDQGFRGAFAIVSDATDRNRASRSELLQRMQAVLDYLPGQAFLKDRESRYLMVNQQFLEYRGLREEDCVGKRDADFHPEVHAVTITQEDLRIFATGEPLRIEHRSERTGRTFQIVKVPLHGTEGEITGLVGMAFEITDRVQADEERRKLEAQLHQAQKMDAIGQLAGGVAHDFNNILSVILSYCTFVLEQIEPRSAVVADVLEIKRAGERAAALTRQLLAFSRKQNVIPTIVEVNEAVEELAKMLRRLIGEHVRLKLDLQADAGSTYIDLTQFEQIVINLAVNARDAMAEGGTLTLSTARTTLTADRVHGMPDVEPGQYVVVSASDTGCGMTPEVAARIFEPFFTTKPTGKGTGMGLSIVYGAVKQNRGHVEAESSPGNGSVFRVYLRACNPVHASIPAGEPQPWQAVRNETILLVEDEPSVRSVTARVLRRAGYEVVEAATGEEAWSIYEEPGRKFQLVISDVIMPGMGGGRLVERIRTVQPRQPILLTTGYTDEMLDTQGSLLDEVKLLYKPVGLAELLRSVRQLIDG